MLIIGLNSSVDTPKTNFQGWTEMITHAGSSSNYRRHKFVVTIHLKILVSYLDILGIHSRPRYLGRVKRKPDTAYLKVKLLLKSIGVNDIRNDP